MPRRGITTDERVLQAGVEATRRLALLDASISELDGTLLRKNLLLPQRLEMERRRASLKYTRTRLVEDVERVRRSRNVEIVD